jgi:hypothetical protein
MNKLKPIASQAEADEVRAKLARKISNTLSIPLDEAERRLDGLTRSGVGAGGDPESPAYQMAVEAFLSIPSSTYAHLK